MPSHVTAKRLIDEGVIGELDRALNDHELVKVAARVGARDARNAALAALAARTADTAVAAAVGTAITTVAAVSD